MDINLPTIILQTVALLILIGLLKKLLYKPVLDFLDQRVADTSKLIDKTEKNHTRSENLLKETKQKLDEAKKQAEDIKDAARHSSLKERDDILEKTEKDTELMLSQAKNEIQNDVQKAKRSLKSFVADVSVLIAEKLLMRELNQEDRKRYIKFYAEKIEEKCDS